jgi:hypothetical protein
LKPYLIRSFRQLPNLGCHSAGLKLLLFILGEPALDHLSLLLR